MTQQKYFILDIESLGLNSWMGDRLTVIGIRTSNGDEHIFMNIDEQETLKDFHDWFQEQKQDFDFMITKNGKAFDIPFIITRAFINNLDNVAKNLKSTLIPYSHIDLHEITDKWVSLDNMARVLNLPVKTGNGLLAIKLWKEGKYEELKEYCRHDLWLTEQVYLRRKMLGELNRENE